MLIIEIARIAVIARLADSRVDLDVLSVAQRRQGFALFGIERHLGARLRGQFEQESFAFPGDGRRLDDTPAENDDLAPFGVEVRWRTGRMDQRQ